MFESLFIEPLVMKCLWNVNKSAGKLIEKTHNVTCNDFYNRSIRYVCYII